MSTVSSGAGAAAAALALLLSTSSTLQAQTVNTGALGGGAAKVVGGAGSAVGGAGAVVGGAGGVIAGAGGVVGGAVGTAVNGAGSAGGTLGTPGGIAGGAMGGLGSTSTLMGPSGSIGGLSGSPTGFGSAAWRMGTGAAQNVSGTVLQKMEAAQQILGRLLSVDASSVTVRLADGSSKAYQISSDMATALRPFIGKSIHLRSTDGVHISSVVGKNDVARGTVTAINGNLVTFVNPTGEIHTIALNDSGIARSHVRVGSSVVSTSNDFGKTVRLSVLNISPRSALSDIYLGRVAALSRNSVVLGIGPSRQQFAIDPAISRILGRMGSSTVAAYAPDGVHITSLMSSPSLMQLVASSRNGARLQTGRVAATVVSATRGRVTLQMPNGDLATYLTNPGNATLQSRVPVTITPLDRVHVRVTAGAKAATLANANLCATVNSSCAGSESGRVIAVSPTSMVVRLGNGDSRTLLGNLTPVAANAGVPVTITPLDAVHVRVLANGRAANLVNASACVTINAGCHATPATVVGTGPSSVSVRLPDGGLTTFQGNPAPLGVSANVPVIVQPLDRTHAMLAANGNALQMADANLCVTINANCSSSTPALASSGNPLHAATAAIDAKAVTAANPARGPVRNLSSATTACVRLNAPGCTPGNTGLTGGVNPSGVASVGNANAAGAARGPVRTASTVANACATLNAPGCGAGRAGNGGGPNTNTATTLATGCVSINGAACVAQAAPINGNRNAGVVPGSGGNPGNGNGGNLNGPNSGAFDGATGPPTRLASFDQLLAYAGSPVACGQDGQVSVNVADYVSGHSMQGATVKLLGSDSPQWATSNDGIVRFFHLTSGTYRVQVSKAGYKPVLSPAFDVNCAHANALQFRLVAANARGGAKNAGGATVAAAPHITAAQIRLMHVSSTCVSARQTRTVVTHRSHRVYTSRVTRKHYFCH